MIPDPLPSATISRFSGLLKTDVTETITTTWPEFLEHLERDPMRAFTGKYDHHGWSAAAFSPPIRDRANVASVGALIFDFNAGTAFERAVDGWSTWYGIVFTTKGHTADSSRLRCILPLSRTVSAAEYHRLWIWGSAMCESMGLKLGSEPADPAAFWYDASTPPGGWRAARLPGAPLDPGPILAAVPPPPPPPRPSLRLITAIDDEGPPPIGDPPPPTWRSELRCKGDGVTPQKTYGNTYLVIANHNAWAGHWSFDELALTPCLDGRPVTEEATDEARRLIERCYGFAPALDDVRHAIGEAASARRFHPVASYLRGLTWDGKERLPGACGALLRNPDPLSGVMLRKWFVAAAARALAPGCKVDTALVLVGERQGRGKSTFFDALADPWFSDSAMDLESKDALLGLHSAWIHEWAELENVVSERHESRIKAFLSSRSDMFRAPYARAVAKHPRNSVIVASTNYSRFLTDVTGNRRYWIIQVPGRINTVTVREARDQLWAEAAAVFGGAVGCKACDLPHDRCEVHRWWLSDEDEDAREISSSAHRVEDVWRDRIEEWALALPPGKRRDEISMLDVLTDALGIEVGRQSKGDQMRAAKALRELGFTRPPGYGKRWAPRDGFFTPRISQ
ncbi:MAG: VapE domain-containing protein [Gemmatimonadaceae bacterium]